MWKSKSSLGLLSMSLQPCFSPLWKHHISVGPHVTLTEADSSLPLDDLRSISVTIILDHRRSSAFALDWGAGAGAGAARAAPRNIVAIVIDRMMMTRCALRSDVQAKITLRGSPLVFIQLLFQLRGVRESYRAYSNYVLEALRT